jgi:hypothetical protein
MKVKEDIAHHLRCIEADLWDYLQDPSDFTCEHFEDIHTLLLSVMDRLGIEPTTNKGETNDD